MTSQKHIEALSNPVFNLIAASAMDLSIDCYVIGGFVRDYLLQRGMAKDIDIVAIGSGIELAKKVASKLPSKPEVTIFKNFGTAMIKLKELEIEFVGARKESYHLDSRKPVVENGTLQEDQNRRDFTINAMAISLNKKDYGHLIDPFDGIKDLENKLIRTPLAPGITYSDDPLRMLRAIRFATQLNFSIHPESLKALTEHKERIKIISKERIVDELHKIMAAKNPQRGLRSFIQQNYSHIYYQNLLHYRALRKLKDKNTKTISGTL